MQGPIPYNTIIVVRPNSASYPRHITKWRCDWPKRSPSLDLFWKSPHGGPLRANLDTVGQDFTWFNASFENMATALKMQELCILLLLLKNKSEFYSTRNLNKYLLGHNISEGGFPVDVPSSQF